jgi:hypothetical protein
MVFGVPRVVERRHPPTPLPAAAVDVGHDVRKSVAGPPVRRRNEDAASRAAVEPELLFAPGPSGVLLPWSLSLTFRPRAGLLQWTRASQPRAGGSPHPAAQRSTVKDLVVQQQTLRVWASRAA